LSIAWKVLSKLDLSKIFSCVMLARCDIVSFSIRWDLS